MRRRKESAKHWNKVDGDANNIDEGYMMKKPIPKRDKKTKKQKKAAPKKKTKSNEEALPSKDVPALSSSSSAKVSVAAVMPKGAKRDGSCIFSVPIPRKKSKKQALSDDGASLVLTDEKCMITPAKEAKSGVAAVQNDFKHHTSTFDSVVDPTTAMIAKTPSKKVSKKKKARDAANKEPTTPAPKPKVKWQCPTCSKEFTWPKSCAEASKTNHLKKSHGVDRKGNKLAMSEGIFYSQRLVVYR